MHGTADTTVPMSGRAIGATRQGDLAEVMAMYSRDKSFVPGASYGVADLTCSHSVDAGGKRLDLCLFDGQHSFTSQRLGAAYDILMQN